MPTPEPSNDGGLWERVKYVTGWPETDEDQLAELARTWRSGGDRFTTGGQFDLSGMGGIWPDPAGTAAAERNQGTLLTTLATAGGMAQLADRVDRFATAVRGCKIDITNIVELNIPPWLQALQLPPGLSEIDQATIRDSVIDQVETRIEGCVRDIGGLGLMPIALPETVPPPGVLGGPLGEPPGTVTEPVPPWVQTGGGPLVQLPGGGPGLAGGPGAGPGTDTGPGLAGGPLGGTVYNTGGEGVPESGAPAPDEPEKPGLTWEPSPKHGPEQRGRANPEPSNPEDTLGRSVPLGPNTPRRVSVDPETGEYSVFDETYPGTGTYHGHSRSWDELTQQQKNALVKGGLTDRRGRIQVTE